MDDVRQAANIKSDARTHEVSRMQAAGDNGQWSVAHCCRTGVAVPVPSQTCPERLSVCAGGDAYPGSPAGWVRSITQLGREKHLYLRDDIEKLKARSLARSGHGVVAASVMNCGEPIIPTSITVITSEDPRYRGRLAVHLVRSGATFETVAELLWTGLWHDEPIRWWPAPRPPALRKLGAAISPLRANDQLLEIFAMFTLQLGMSNGSVAERVRSGRTLDAAREIIQTLTGCFGYASRNRRF